MDAVMIMGLSTINGIGRRKIMRLLSLVNHHKKLISLDYDAVQKILSRELWQKVRSLSWDRFAEQYEKSPYAIITLEDKNYPSQLRNTMDPPLLLYVHGEIPMGNAIAIVGTRKASAYGKKQARIFAEELSSRGIVIISGLATGIDAAAHNGAVTRGRTVAVLGSGIERIYPSHHRYLANTISENGACISEYAPQAPALAHHFPERNRIVAGLVAGIIVIEAPQKSGALITANIGVENGRDIFVVPGMIGDDQYLGGHKLIQSGAKLVTSVEDVLEEYPQWQMTNDVQQIHLSKIQYKIWNVLSDTPQSIDDISNTTQLPIDKVMSELMEMRIEGIVVCSHFHYYRSRGIVCCDN
ncbi:DNA-processing protein DprA [Candidatus Uabimicrobium amorphum]|uniref:DNA protecting protein DprA n=1 Tax=Uabimicrobium amorphum TaxID=2596890 RepID=A0A5S9F3C8_UABAM|nr:DNA-processing protein DprA [Candidatus Uabimicrobium amorphum]BBM83022.1 DNA protecting protein DprA [Candidatus Uabimicrobium amorphum]